MTIAPGLPICGVSAKRAACPRTMCSILPPMRSSSTMPPTTTNSTPATTTMRRCLARRPRRGCAVAAALAMLAQPGAQPQIVRSGETSVENLMRELLKPALAEWLEKNLPPLVERLVTDEIRRISGKKG